MMMMTLTKFVSIISIITIFLRDSNGSKLANETRIIIIGTGPSGIAAGTKLLQSGFHNIIYLEAEGRLGGRIHTIEFGKGVLDMGAQWCHGEVGNVVHELAKPLDLLGSATTTAEMFELRFPNGEKLDNNVSAHVMKIGDGIVEQFEDKRPSTSLGNYFVEKYSEEMKSKKNEHIDRHLALQFLNFYEKFQSAYEASDNWYETSPNGNYSNCEGDQLLNWKGAGYSTVLNVLMKKLPDPKQDLHLEERIQFNKTVKTIDWKSTNQTQITCADGSLYTADHVICTVSLGVLKGTHQSLFEPHLPKKKIDAINGLSFGTVNKLYLEFKEPFWSSDFKGFNLLWNQEELQAVRQSTADWIEGISGFYTVDYQPNVLCGWICGISARHMEKTPKEDVLKNIMIVLRKFLPNVSDPIRFERSTWHTNPNFRGSYSSRSITADFYDTTPAYLAEPLYGNSDEPLVLFAGEATSEVHYSTVHGAIETGWREAQRLIDLYKEM